MEEKIIKKFNSFKDNYSQSDAEKVMKNKSKILGIMKNKTLCKYFDDVNLFFKLLKDFFSGKYKIIPIGTIAAIIGTLLYILLPFDLVLDFIPGGFLDDLSILLVCLNFTKFDIDEYKKTIDQSQEKNNKNIQPNKENRYSLKTILKKFFMKAATHLNLIGLATNKFLDVTVEPLAEWIINNKICPFIKERLDDFYKRTLINSLITLILNIIGFFFVIFDPFGKKNSYIIASIFFLSVIIFSIYRFVSFMMNKQYREISIQVIKNIWKEKSISNGIKNVVLDSIPKVAKLYKGVELMAKFFPALEKIPDVQRIIKYVISVFWKKVTLFFGLLLIYMVAIYLVIKPLLLKVFN